LENLLDGVPMDGVGLVDSLWKMDKTEKLEGAETQ